MKIYEARLPYHIVSLTSWTCATLYVYVHESELDGFINLRTISTLSHATFNIGRITDRDGVFEYYGHDCDEVGDATCLCGNVMTELLNLFTWTGSMAEIAKEAFWDDFLNDAIAAVSVYSVVIS